MMTKKHLFDLSFFKSTLCLAAFLILFGSASAQGPSADINAEKHNKSKVKTDGDVDQMPYIASCKSDSEEATKKCTSSELGNFIGKYLKYPKEASKKGIEGKAVISFVINTKGAIENVKIVKNVAQGCGEEAARVVALMNEKGIKWVPAVKDGKNVNLVYNIPVSFKLK